MRIDVDRCDVWSEHIQKIRNRLYGDKIDDGRDIFSLCR